MQWLIRESWNVPVCCWPSDCTQLAPIHQAIQAAIDLLREVVAARLYKFLYRLTNSDVKTIVLGPPVSMTGQAAEILQSKLYWLLCQFHAACHSIPRPVQIMYDVQMITSEQYRAVSSEPCTMALVSCILLYQGARPSRTTMCLLSSNCELTQVQEQCKAPIR